MPGLGDNYGAPYPDGYSVPAASGNNHPAGNLYNMQHHASYQATASPPLQKGSQSPVSNASGDGTPSLSPIPDQRTRYTFNPDWNNAQQRYQQPQYPSPIQVLCIIHAISFNAHSVRSQDWSHLRAPRAGLVAPQLGLPEFGAAGNAIRIGVPLKSLPTVDHPQKSSTPKALETSTKDVEMANGNSRRKSTTPPSRIYPLLTSGDPAFKLPALRTAGRSPSTDSSNSPPPTPGSATTTTRRSASPAQHVSKATLPSLNSLSLQDPSVIPKLHNRTEEISFEERIRHAKLIRALLVAINQQWLYENERTQSSASPVTSIEDSDDGSDVEMSGNRQLVAI